MAIPIVASKSEALIHLSLLVVPLFCFVMFVKDFHSKVDALKIEIGKGTKEMRALQLMIQTYTNTPQVENLRALIRSC